MLAFVNKVDVVTAREYARNDGGRPVKRGTVTRAPYRREPYVRARIGGGANDTVDAKAISWDRNTVQLKWVDDNGSMRTQWVPASDVRRITRDESTWRDPYDDYGFYYPDEQ
jgi:hypothetical protein